MSELGEEGGHGGSCFDARDGGGDVGDDRGVAWESKCTFSMASLDAP